MTVTPVRVLVEVDQFETFQDGRAGLSGALAQDRLEPRLADEQPPTRADRFDARVETADDVGQLATSQAVHGDDGALRQELLFGGAFDLVLNVGLTEELQRAQVEVRGARHRRATPQTLE